MANNLHKLWTLLQFYTIPLTEYIHCIRKYKDFGEANRNVYDVNLGHLSLSSFSIKIPYRHMYSLFRITTAKKTVMKLDILICTIKPKKPTRSKKQLLLIFYIFDSHWFVIYVVICLSSYNVCIKCQNIKTSHFLWNVISVAESIILFHSILPGSKIT